MEKNISFYSYLKLKKAKALISAFLLGVTWIYFLASTGIRFSYEWMIVFSMLTVLSCICLYFVVKAFSGKYLSVSEGVICDVKEETELRKRANFVYHHPFQTFLLDNGAWAESGSRYFDGSDTDYSVGEHVYFVSDGRRHTYLFKKI